MIQSRISAHASPPLLAFLTLAFVLPVHDAAAQTPWYARDRWQLELATGSVIFECQLRGRTGDQLLVIEGDSLRPAAKTVATGARGTFGALAGSDDEVYQLTLLTVPERRVVVDTLLRRHPPRS